MIRIYADVDRESQAAARNHRLRCTREMLIKDWDVAYSFGIRYKHLMINPQGQQETDKDIDHILGVQSDEDDHEDDDAEDSHGANNDRDDMVVYEDDSEDKA
jgi:hypothetical protein